MEVLKSELRYEKNNRKKYILLCLVCIALTRVFFNEVYVALSYNNAKFTVLTDVFLTLLFLTGSIYFIIKTIKAFKEIKIIKNKMIEVKNS